MLRVNVERAPRSEVLDEFPEGTPTRISPWGIRLPPNSRIDGHPAFQAGLLEVQDEGSQLIALACGAKNGEAIIDPVYDLFEHTMKRLGRDVPVLLERDFNIPELEELQGEIERLRTIKQSAIKTTKHAVA